MSLRLDVSDCDLVRIVCKSSNVREKIVRAKTLEM
jgi:hypothetical protein